MTYLIVFLTFFNIICWIIFFIRFKKIFSTDKIVEKTKNQMNKMIQDIDQVTDRDMYLVREASKNIKKLMEDADKKMEEFSVAGDRLRTMIAETDKINKSNSGIHNSDLFKEPAPTPIKRKTLTNPQINSYLKNTKAAQKINPDSSFEVTPMVQGDLFSSEASQSSSILKDETTITSDGAAYKEVPLIITEVYEDKPAEETDSTENNSVYENKNKKPNKTTTLQENVILMHNQGYENDEIALALSCSRTEVDFIIDML